MFDGGEYFFERHGVWKTAVRPNGAPLPLHSKYSKREFYTPENSEF